jgi:hypothetical protein
LSFPNNNIQGRADMFRFIVVRGVLGWGVPTALIFLLLQYLLHRGADLQHGLYTVVAFASGGIPFGAFLWRMKGQRRKAAPTISTMMLWGALAASMAICFVLMSLHETS